MNNFMYNKYRGVYMSKKKRKSKTSLSMRIMGIIMLLLMVASSVIGIIAYML